MGYYDYSQLPDEQRERLYQAWCKQNKRDPEADGTADDFLDSLDQRFADNNEDSNTV
ncbi:hypothetical protein UFOVP327_14 [uncultured Caudovirales phage]|uniref:Uncharacterized protein n=1 Tax=uncultured Caudovirales phage TaxID=2100421 RepID=A0A6J5LU44_9CAUD|nr:hypothetical protein UFOVP327_14 [uncultured Caudovirales phage]